LNSLTSCCRPVRYRPGSTPCVDEDAHTPQVRLGQHASTARRPHSIGRFGVHDKGRVCTTRTAYQHARANAFSTDSPPGMRAKGGSGG
jgi:hypothetical protein